MSFIIKATKGRGLLLALLLALTTTSCIGGGNKKSSTIIPGAATKTSQDAAAKKQSGIDFKALSDDLSKYAKQKEDSVSTPEPLPIAGLFVTALSLAVVKRKQLRQENRNNTADGTLS
ncbi:MAG: hypothetical protein AAGN15_19735 [Cyanobacteria bacterium J06581_3]